MDQMDRDHGGTWNIETKHGPVASNGELTLEIHPRLAGSPPSVTIKAVIDSGDDRENPSSDIAEANEDNNEISMVYQMNSANNAELSCNFSEARDVDEENKPEKGSRSSEEKFQQPEKGQTRTDKKRKRGDLSQPSGKGTYSDRQVARDDSYEPLPSQGVSLGECRNMCMESNAWCLDQIAPDAPQIEAFNACSEVQQQCFEDCLNDSHPSTGWSDFPEQEEPPKEEIKPRKPPQPVFRPWRGDPSQPSGKGTYSERPFAKKQRELDPKLKRQEAERQIKIKERRLEKYRMGRKVDSSCINRYAKTGKSAKEAKEDCYR